MNCRAFPSTSMSIIFEFSESFTFEPGRAWGTQGHELLFSTKSQLTFGNRLAWNPQYRLGLLHVTGHEVTDPETNCPLFDLA